jgi:hypothetical protein
MGYFDALAASSFKNLENGKRAFYPWGKLGKGYELSSDEQYESFQRFVIRYYMIVLPLGIAAGVLRHWVVLAVILPGAMVAYTVIVKRKTRDLPRTDVKLTFKDSYENQARKQSPWILWPLLVVSLLFVAGGLLVVATPGKFGVGLLCVAFFGACAAAAGWMLILRRRVLRQPDPEKTRVFD